MVLFTTLALNYAPRDILGCKQDNPSAKEYSRSTRNRVIVATGLFLDITLLAALIITPLVYQPAANFFSHDFADFFIDHPEFGHPIVAIASPIILFGGLILGLFINELYRREDFRSKSEKGFSKMRNEEGFLCLPARKVQLYEKTSSSL